MKCETACIGQIHAVLNDAYGINESRRKHDLQDQQPAALIMCEASGMQRKSGSFSAKNNQQSLTAEKLSDFSEPDCDFQS